MWAWCHWPGLTGDSFFKVGVKVWSSRDGNVVSVGIVKVTATQRRPGSGGSVPCEPTEVVKVVCMIGEREYEWWPLISMEGEGTRAEEA